jgi:hypothetical protein
VTTVTDRDVTRNVTQAEAEAEAEAEVKGKGFGYFVTGALRAPIESLHHRRIPNRMSWISPDRLLSATAPIATTVAAGANTSAG